MSVQRRLLKVCILLSATAPSLTGIGWAAQPALQVSTPAGRTLELSIDDLKQLPQQSAQIEESPGVTSEYRGVSLHEVLKAAGAPAEKAMRGAALKQYLLVQAADGYQAVFALTETDPAFSDRLILLCHSKNAQPLSADEGPLRLVIPAEKRHARWVRQVRSITVKQAD